MPAITANAMATFKRNPSHSRTTLTRKPLGYHLLQTLPKSHGAKDVVDSARRDSPPIDADPLSSSDEGSKPADDHDEGPSVSGSSNGNWQEPQMRVTIIGSGKQTWRAGSSPTAFRDPSTKMNIPSSTQRRSTRTQNGKASPKRSREIMEANKEDNLLDEFGLIPLSQGQSRFKKRKVYGPVANIHGSGNARGFQYSSQKSQSIAQNGEKDGFRTPNLEVIGEKLNGTDHGLPDRSFKNPTAKYAASPRSLRSLRRSTQERHTSPCEPDVNGFKEPIIHPAEPCVFSQDKEPCEFIIPASGQNHASRDIRNVAEGVLCNGPGSFKIPAEAPCPTSSATASLTLSPFDEAEHSTASSLSSPPASPILDASQEHHEFLALDIPEYHVPVVARCPMCKEEVDRDFLEDFVCGRRMDVRSQTRFCRAHKQETAKIEWKKRRYPEIDWSTFDVRLKRYHPQIKSILDSDVPSFYRNVLEDSVNSGRNRTLHQSIMGAGFHGLTPGYYGSRGARMDNIISNFSSQIRRLAATDKLISSGGVSGYVQAVLVPELAVLLVKEDMQVDDETARVILKESIKVGDLLNEEEEEVIKGKVIGDDSDDSDDDVNDGY
ncbi:MAG: hypothetical protein M1830_006199 [Pleopsidium flavum]|nr:MAG: hypothetical protein M1830_006199 [Pleopsidium flavum]